MGIRHFSLSPALLGAIALLNQSPFLDTLTGFEYTPFFLSSQLIDSEQDTTDGTSCHLENPRLGAWPPDSQHDYGTGYCQLMLEL